MKVLYIVVPCYNEEEVLEETTRQLKEKMKNLIKDKKISKESRVMYVNDGSKDNTWKMIEEISEKEKLFTGISLSRNRGHQNALLGGLMTAKNYADIVISMDADLQDDINAIDEMIDKYYEGADIVYGVRSARKTDTWFKKTTAEGFYKFMKMMGADIVYNHADYRLASKRVLDELEKFNEVNLFLRGMFPLIGYKTEVVYYERNERVDGESKYPLKKMLKLASDGIIGFSTKPLKLVGGLGIISILISLVILIYSILSYIFSWGNLTAGWTSIMVAITLFSGVQLLSLWIIAEYIGRIYDETKQRPQYIIDKKINIK